MKTSVPPIQMVKKEDPRKKKFDIAGLKNIYEFETQLPGSGEYVRFRPFTTGQIKRILAFEGETNPIVISEVINTLIEEVIISEDIKVHDLFIKDREYLLLQIRNKTKGSKWETEWKCEKCGSQNLLNVDMSDIPVKRLEKELVDYELKIMDTLIVNMKFITVLDEMSIVGSIDKKLNDSQKSAEIVISMIAASIDSIVVNDELIDDMSLSDKKYFLEELPASVYHSISGWLEDNEYGMNFKVKNKCHSCDHVLEFDVTPENFFF